MRCVNESRYYDSSVFLTLTLSDDKLAACAGEKPSLFPSDVAEFHRPFQLFMKRARKAREVDEVDVVWFCQDPSRSWRRCRKTIRPRLAYFMAGEYGERRKRPHWHAIVFGIDFYDKVLAKTNPFDLYRSAELERLWPYGNVLIGPVNKETAQYVAGYLVSVDDREDSPRYGRVDLQTGEFKTVAKEYGRMSLRPAVGRRFVEEFSSDVSICDASVVNGKEFRPPKYYDRLMRGFMQYDRESGFCWPRAGIDPVRFAKNVEKRAELGLSLAGDSTPARLRVAETVVRSRLALKRRILE